MSPYLPKCGEPKHRFGPPTQRAFPKGDITAWGKRCFSKSEQDSHLQRGMLFQWECSRVKGVRPTFRKDGKDYYLVKINSGHLTQSRIPGPCACISGRQFHALSHWSSSPPYDRQRLLSRLKDQLQWSCSYCIGDEYVNLCNSK
ncbi:hypothetical protein LSTR_LSTR006670 [Laodelphax striatellus]|uniref:Uncharacterized protein n=1 Tax=Laodelphax striatellus TaxID=195883 RepID=A0A482X8P3_LAOST|nr:hypothetical protein LSTR_LSTR017081 [Laodelphax striatellus]RZF42077.1 hypothetical protein LSTR_LSTR006670 [Laodelphax striatellus]